MKNRSLYFVLTTFVFLGLMACEKSEKIDDFPLIDPTLVVNSFFTYGEPIILDVSRSLSVLDNAELKRIPDARVLIFEDEILVDSVLAMGADDRYLSQTIPQSGKSYRVELSHPNYETVSSSKEYLPEQVNVTKSEVMITDSMTWSWWYIDLSTGDTIFKRDGNASMRCKVSINDPSASDNFYVIRVMASDTLAPPGIEETYFVYLSSSDLSLDNEASLFSDNYGNTTLYFNDEVFNGQEYHFQFEFNDWNYSTSKKYYVELSSMSHTAYMYLRTREALFASENDPFAEPVRVYNNIEGGYGVFAGISKSFYELKP